MRDISITEDLDPGCYAVRVGRINYKKINEKQYGLKQFPIWPAYAITGHCAQGQTAYNGVCVGHFGPHRNGFSGWLHVVASRSPTLDGLTILEEVLRNPMDYKFRMEVQTHYKWLCSKGVITLENLSASFDNLWDDNILQLKESMKDLDKKPVKHKNFVQEIRKTVRVQNRETIQFLVIV